MTKQRKVLFVIIVLLGLIISSVAVGYLWKIRWRSNSDQIYKFFPIFEQSKDCEWKTESHWPFNFGPSDTNIKGFIQLNESEADKLLQSYKWYLFEGTPYKIEPSPDFSNVNVNWLISNDLGSQIMPPTFVGMVYLDVDNAIIYFYAEFN